jgi:serine/threonine-protein kinase RsbW
MAGAEHDLRIRLELESVAESVTLIRSVVGTIGRSLGFEHRLLDDLRTAISEAANNVVLHAYGHRTGPLLFSMAVRDDQVEAVVRDRGCSMRRVSLDNRGLGMGVVVISALADHAEFQSDEGTGTEVRMTFKRPVPVPGRLGQLDFGVWALLDLSASAVQRVPSG